MLHFNEPSVRKRLMEGNVGLEKESLRVDMDGHFSHKSHPFADDENIVRDFCENQVEINTGVSSGIDAALQELERHQKRVNKTLAALPDREYLWPFSNPPFIEGEHDIPVARFPASLNNKTEYRNYLAKVYGKYKMTFSGIHVNYSLSEDLLRADFACAEETDFMKYRNQLYLSLTRNLINNGWIVTVLLAASPVLDGSFLRQGMQGQTDFSGMSSVRCSEMGYWNHFVPVLNYETLLDYVESIRKYIDDGWISAQSELYYPIRIKSQGVNDLNVLLEKGVDHIEVRNVDLNPYAYAGIQRQDLRFIQLLLIYDACIEPIDMNAGQQIHAMRNFKNAAHFDIDTASLMQVDGTVCSVRKASLALLNDMKEFYGKLDIDVDDVLDQQIKKLTDPSCRYAQQVMDQFGHGFVEKGMEFVQARYE